MIASTQRNEYFTSKVLTAPPHKLHLMLIEGAIRFGQQAEEAMRRGDVAAASQPLMRTIDILGEMLVGVRESKTELNRKLADFYLFLFRRVSEAKVNDDVEKLAEALKLLEHERETWQLVCEKLETDQHCDAGSANHRSGDEPPRAPLARNGTTAWSPSSTCGLSLEA
jgi:flagellar protein FliS